jgi:hypothetical protein
MPACLPCLPSLTPLSLLLSVPLTVCKWAGKEKGIKKHLKSPKNPSQVCHQLFFLESYRHVVPCVVPLNARVGNGDQPIFKQGACTRCKSRKVKCEYEDNSTKCRKCIGAGFEDLCTREAPERPKREALRHDRQSSQAKAPQMDTLQVEGSSGRARIAAQNQKAGCEFLSVSVSLHSILNWTSL